MSLTSYSGHMLSSNPNPFKRHFPNLVIFLFIIILEYHIILVVVRRVRDYAYVRTTTLVSELF